MSKKKSLTSEERVAAVQEYLDGKGGYKAIARKYNIGATTMKRMVCRKKPKESNPLQRHHRIDTIPMK